MNGSEKKNDNIRQFCLKVKLKYIRVSMFVCVQGPSLDVVAIFFTIEASFHVSRADVLFAVTVDVATGLVWPILLLNLHIT